MKIRFRGKLLFASVSVSLICLAMGSLAVRNINLVASQSRVMYDKVAAPLGILYVIDEAYEETRVAVRDEIYSTDESSVIAQAKAIQGLFEEIASNTQAFEATLITETARTSFENFKTAFQSYKTELLRALTLDTAKRDAEALAVLKGPVQAATDRLEAALDAVLKENVDQGKIRADRNDQLARATTLTMSAITLGVFAVCFLFGFGFAISFSQPIRAAADLAGYIAAGDLTKEVPARHKLRSDELGTLSVSLDRMRQDIAESVGGIRSSVGAIRDMSLDLAASMEQTSSAVTQIKSSIGLMQGRVKSQGTSVLGTSATLDRIIRSIDSLDAGIEDQAASVAESSASIEQMLRNIGSVSSNVERLAETFSSLIAASADGKEKIGAVHAVISDIAGQSEKLFEANSVIGELAERTNILAMNAAIEAAHAGDAGKGFAVVADEIRNLAEISAERTKEISSDVGAIKGSIDAVVEAAGAAEHSFSSVLALIGPLDTLENEIRNAMIEQGEGSRQILEAIANINQITRRVRDESTEMTVGSRAIAKEMAELKAASERLQTEMAEIARGTEEIDTSTSAVSALSARNSELVEAVSSKVARYTLA